MSARAAAALGLAAALALAAARAVAQAPADTTAAPAAPAVAADSADSTRGVGPFGAMWRSMVLPGWGQAVTGRHVTGAVLVAWEGVTAAMTIKAKGEVRYLERTGSTLVNAKRQEVQDWLVLWVFNHLFAGAEAFVSSHLRDFPPDLKLRAVPGGILLAIPLP